MTSIEQLLPPSLLLSPHLSAYRYFFVCTLTIASWDTLVLTTRAWRMTKTKEWPMLKIIMLLLRHLMPIEFIILAVSCFNPAFTPEVCSKYYLFEPIMTAILMSLSSLALIIRVRAIHDKDAARQRAITMGLGALFVAQVAIHFACCFFYHPLNLQNQQGCIAAPKHGWGGIYWVLPTILYLATLGLAVTRSLESIKDRPLGWWKLINRDGLNLYFTIFGINFVNVIYFFVTKPSDDADPLKIIVTSLATVLTSTMTMRVILLVRGSLVAGGSFHGSTPGNTGNSASLSGGGRHPHENTSTTGNGPFHITASGPNAAGPHRGGKGISAIGAPAGLTAPRTSNVGSNKYSQPTFAVPRPVGGLNAGPDGTYGNDSGKFVYGEEEDAEGELDVKNSGDVADEMDRSVWEKTKENTPPPRAHAPTAPAGVPTFNPQDPSYASGKHKEVWDQ